MIASVAMCQQCEPMGHAKFSTHESFNTAEHVVRALSGVLSHVQQARPLFVILFLVAFFAAILHDIKRKGLQNVSDGVG